MAKIARTFFIFVLAAAPVLAAGGETRTDLPDLGSAKNDYQTKPPAKQDQPETKDPTKAIVLSVLGMIAAYYIAKGNRDTLR